MLRAISTTLLTLSLVGAAHAQMPVPLLDNEPATAQSAAKTCLTIRPPAPCCRANRQARNSTIG